jgi:glycosyltransferase involved in cell wall biosynthesis
VNDIATWLTGGSTSSIHWIIVTWVVLACLAWSWSYLKASYTLRSIQRIKDLQPQTPQNYPKLSIIISACNEAHTLQQAMRTILKQNYPDLEIILVNDRSTDDTGSLVDQLAAQDNRIVPVHVTHLPAGWLGKVHALHVGCQKATGEWLLFTDADIHFAPGVLRKTVAFCLEQQLDHLTIAPEVYSQSFWLDVTQAAFALLFFANLKTAGIGKPKSDYIAGIGAFNLVQKAALARTEGFSWLRMEVLDDLGLGLMLHQAGAKSGLLIGTDEIGLAWYPSLPAMMRGLEKNLFGAAAQYRYSRLLATIAVFWLINLGWAIALFQPLGSWLWELGIAAFGCVLLYNWAVLTEIKRWKPAYLLTPIGQVILSVMVLRSAFCCWRQQGIIWRGTQYPLQELRAGQRVKL